jgi:hypothetical protein
VEGVLSFEIQGVCGSKSAQSIKFSNEIEEDLPCTRIYRCLNVTKIAAIERTVAAGPNTMATMTSIDTTILKLVKELGTNKYALFKQQ